MSYLCKELYNSAWCFYLPLLCSPNYNLLGKKRKHWCFIIVLNFQDWFCTNIWTFISEKLSIVACYYELVHLFLHVYRKFYFVFGMYLDVFVFHTFRICLPKYLWTVLFMPLFSSNFKSPQRFVSYNCFQ